MEYIIIIGLILYLLYKLKLIKPSKSTSRSSNRSSKSDVDLRLKVFKHEVNADGILVKIHEDVFDDLLCQFYRDGSPYVDIRKVRDGFEYRYNVKTSRWLKDGDCPVLPEMRRELSKILKDEWQAAWKAFGYPEYQSKRKKAAPAPTHVEYTKREIRAKLTYDFDKLVGLPTDHQAEGSSGSTYTVNLAGLSCTCPDFWKRRQSYPANDIRRMCKHQVRTLIDVGKNTKITSNNMIHKLVRGAASRERGIPLFSQFYEIEINEKLKGPKVFHVMLPVENHPWAEVFFFAKRSYTKSGYNMVEKRWARHTNPFPSGSRRAYNLVVGQILNR